jgi:hypothetical protein
VQPSSKAWLSRKPLKYSLFKWKERKKSNHLVNFLNFRSLFLHEFHFKGKEIRLLVTTKKKMMKRLLMKHWLPLRWHSVVMLPPLQHLLLPANLSM